MACNESDDKVILEREIRKIENDIASLDKELYFKMRDRKFLYHRLSDLQYELKTKGSTNGTQTLL